MPDSTPSDRTLILCIIYMVFDLWAGNRTKYRSVALTTAIFAILFVISLFFMLVFKLKEKVWKK